MKIKAIKQEVLGRTNCLLLYDLDTEGTGPSNCCRQCTLYSAQKLCKQDRNWRGGYTGKQTEKVIS
jgi:predicted lipoprotein with Yx(FWY)xxD motif